MLAIRQAVEFFVDDDRDFCVFRVPRSGSVALESGHRRCLRLESPAPPRPVAEFNGRGGKPRGAANHSRASPATGPAPRRAGEDEERGLPGVFNVVFVFEDGAAGGQDHRPVPRQQAASNAASSRDWVVPGQELAIAKSDGRPVMDQVAKVTQRLPGVRRLPWMASSNVFPVSSSGRGYSSVVSPDTG